MPGFPYVRLDNVIVTHGFTPIYHDDQLRKAINVTDNKDTLTSDFGTWTGTSTTGREKGSHCNNWTDGTDQKKGRLGNANKTNDKWVNDISDEKCDEIHRLYCFEQSPWRVHCVAGEPPNTNCIPFP